MVKEQPIDRATALPARRPSDLSRRADAPLAILVSIVAALIGLILFAWAVLFITKGRFLKSTFESIASRMSERQVRVAGDFQFYFDPIDVKFLADGLTISNPGWASRPNVFEAQHIDTRIATFPLIFGHRRIEWLDLVDGHADLEWDKAHQHNTWTFGDPSAPGKPFQMPEIVRAQVSGTEVRYRDPKMALSSDVKIGTVNAQDNRVSNAIGFSGVGTLRAAPFTLSGALRSPNQTIAGGRTAFELHVDAVHTRVDVSGTLPGVTQFDGADLHARVRGQNLRDLFDLARIPVPDTRAYDLKSDVTKQGDQWRFTHLAGRYGDSDLGGSMTATTGARVKLTADLASKRVDIVDVGPFIGYNPTALAIKGAKAAVKQTGTPRIIPDAPLRVDAIKAFDAHVDYKVTDLKQPFVPLSNIALTLDLDHSLLKLSPLTADIAGGHIASDIAINARGPQVVTDYDIRLSPTPLNRLFRSSGVFDSGTTGTLKARIKMSGTGNTLRDSLATSNGRIAVILPSGTVWTKYAQLSEFDIGVFLQRLLQKQLKKPIQINCGLIAFTVRNGIAATDPVLIDTNANVMTAKGGFSFKDESLDLAFRADGKKLSLFSGQSPVGIQGYFAAPKIQILTPQLLARVGASVALGVVAAPLAAVLAFVDPGDAKGAACGPVLSGADAAQQRTSKGKPRSDVGTLGQNASKAKSH